MGLQIDIAAILANHAALAAHAPTARAAAVVKADAYGLGAATVAPALYRAGVRDFFVALAQEGRAIRPLLPPDARINVLSGHMAGADLTGLTPVLNSPEQFFRDRAMRPGQPFAIQLDSGMNRLGMEAAEWAANTAQLATFRAMTDGCGVPRSLAATGGILLGPDYHFDIVRPGVGLYGGMPFADARGVVTLSLRVIQTRDVRAGEMVGYGASWHAPRDCRIATVDAGYADGILRSLSGKGAHLFAGDTACPIVGRVSMDLITVDVTALATVPDRLTLIGAHQPIDRLADIAGTIGYEVLTSLGLRYERTYL